MIKIAIHQNYDTKMLFTSSYDKKNNKKIKFLIQNTMKELNAIIHKREYNIIQTIRDLKIKIKINKKIFETLVNSKAISNFMF